MEEINKLIADNNFAQAKSKLEELLKTDNKNIEDLKFLGRCYVNHGQ